jgi:phosphotransferase system enzyme I (PtsP)
LRAIKKENILMLKNSQKILKKIKNATQLEEALRLVVQMSLSSIDADACLFYLKDLQTDQYSLMAAAGLIPAAIDEAEICINDELVRWVGTHKESINLANATDHPCLRNISVNGNVSFHGFMGAPVIHYGREIGVLVAQKNERRRYDNDEAAFFTTLAAQLGGAINHLLAKWNFGKQLNGTSQGRIFLRGIPCAPGVCIGNIVLSQPIDLHTIPDRKVSDIKTEEVAFLVALNATKKELRESSERMCNYLPTDFLSVFEVHISILEADRLKAKTIDRIRSGQWAKGALTDTILELESFFEQIEDPYLSARAEDIRLLGRQILFHLQGDVLASDNYPKHTILAGMEISLVELSKVPQDRLAGIICMHGSALSHIAIICREIGIPAVIGLTDLSIGHLEDCEIAMDGNQGEVFINPLPADIIDFQQRIQEERAISEQLETQRNLPAKTLDGISIPLYVNLGIGKDKVSTDAEKYEGVGLYRTEYFFIGRNTLPTEDEQYDLYCRILESFAPKPVTIRTLDAGGDKELPFFFIAEANPFLGMRGIRLTLDHPEIFLTQLRALLRANSLFNNLQILLPMISRVNEIDQTLSLIERAYLELIAEGQTALKPRIGAMLEVPSAVYLITALSKRVDFFSIGTNDLTQYLLAVDRNNSRVQDIYDSLHPAVIHVIKDIVKRAHIQNKPVGVCGEMAGNPASALLLLGLGIDSLSMNPSSVPRVKWTIRSFTLQQARELADKTLETEDESYARQLLNDALSSVGLDALVKAGKF